MQRKETGERLFKAKGTAEANARGHSELRKKESCLEWLEVRGWGRSGRRNEQPQTRQERVNLAKGFEP